MKRTNTTTAGGTEACPEPLQFKFKPAIEAGAQKLEVRAATEPEDMERCQAWFGEEHYLGPVRAAGDRLHQIVLEEGRSVAVLLWAASALHLKDRDEWIGWDRLTCARRLKLVVSNWRYLVLEETRRPNLASQCLASALRALPAQWEQTYGYRPVLAESFTDPESHAGTCYKASGWTAIGMSKGFERHRCEFYVPNDRPKKLWVRELISGKAGDARAVLCAHELPAAHASGETSGGGVRSVLKADQLRSLAQVFREIPDPRTRASMRYPLSAVLTIISMALLGGAVHITDLLGQTVSLVDAEDGVPVAVICNDKGEMAAAQKLLGSEEVNLINATVSADALHCQHETAREIVTRGGDYILRIKKNQPSLLKAAETKSAAAPPLFRQAKRATGE